MLQVLLHQNATAAVQAKLVLTEGNTWLSDEEMEMLVMLRMNKRFISFMRKYYPMSIGEAVPSVGTVLTEEQNVEDEVRDAVEIDQ